MTKKHKIILAIAALVITIAAVITALYIGYFIGYNQGYSEGKNHVIYTQKIYPDKDNQYNVVIDGEIHSYE